MNELEIDHPEPQAQAKPMNDPYKQYRKELSAMGTAAMMQKKAEGEWMHQASYGYRTLKDSEGRITLDTDPATFKHVLKAWQLREEGFSMKEIADYLNRKGVRTKRGCKLTPTSVWRFLAHFR